MLQGQETFHVNSRDSDSLAYNDVAPEYYGSHHRTSRNFDAATHWAFDNKVAVPAFPDGRVLEPGAGRGRVEEYLGVSSTRVIQIDISEAMLRQTPREVADARIQADALQLPVRDDTVAAVAAFLYDAYNLPAFYSEVARLLQPGGVFIGTLPHNQWGTNLRASDNMDQAEFDLVDGRTVSVDSHLSEPSQLRRYCEQAGLSIESLHEITLPDEVTEISPDISSAADNAGLPVEELPVVQVVLGRY
jgi:SAM-dependent methyltransferase